jgi:preprotein translocase subunit SecY
MLMVFRFGSYVVLTRCNSFRTWIRDHRIIIAPNDLLTGLINIFTGGAFNNAAIFALGYHALYYGIDHHSAFRLCGTLLPALAAERRGIGRKKLNQITRLLTLAITLVQGGGYLTYLVAGVPLIPISLRVFSGFQYHHPFRRYDLCNVAG